MANARASPSALRVALATRLYNCVQDAQVAGAVLAVGLVPVWAVAFAAASAAATDAATL